MLVRVKQPDLNCWKPSSDQRRTPAIACAPESCSARRAGSSPNSQPATAANSSGPREVAQAGLVAAPSAQNGWEAAAGRHAQEPVQAARRPRAGEHHFGRRCSGAAGTAGPACPAALTAAGTRRPADEPSPGGPVLHRQRRRGDQQQRVACGQLAPLLLCILAGKCPERLRGARATARCTTPGGPVIPWWPCRTLASRRPPPAGEAGRQPAGCRVRGRLHLCCGHRCAAAAGAVPRPGRAQASGAVGGPHQCGLPPRLDTGKQHHSRAGQGQAHMHKPLQQPPGSLTPCASAARRAPGDGVRRPHRAGVGHRDSTAGGHLHRAHGQRQGSGLPAQLPPGVCVRQAACTQLELPKLAPWRIGLVHAAAKVQTGRPGCWQPCWGLRAWTLGWRLHGSWPARACKLLVWGTCAGSAAHRAFARATPPACAGSRDSNVHVWDVRCGSQYRSDAEGCPSLRPVLTLRVCGRRSC